MSPGRATDSLHVEVETGRRRHDREDGDPVHLPGRRDLRARGAGQRVGRACRPIRRALLEGHVQRLGPRLWSRFDIRIDGPPRSQEIISVCTCSTSCRPSPRTRSTSTSGVPARGLHGEAYRGHVFWDELFIFPFLNLRLPMLTRSLLEYRYRRLPEARAGPRRRPATEAPCSRGRAGATAGRRPRPLHLNPRSGRWLPDDSHLQRHVKIAIAYNAWQYYQVAGDVRVPPVPRRRAHPRDRPLLGQHRDVRSRTAIDTRSAGSWDPTSTTTRTQAPRKPGLDNNAYTNVMAAWVLCRALDVLDGLSRPPSDRAARPARAVTADELDVLGRDQPQDVRAVPRRRSSASSTGTRDLEELDWLDYRERYGDIQRLDRILEAEGDTPEPLQGVQAGRRADALLPARRPRSCGDLLERLGYRFDPMTDIPRNVRLLPAPDLARLDPVATGHRVGAGSWIGVDRGTSSCRPSRATSRTCRGARRARGSTSAPWPARSIWCRGCTRARRSATACSGWTLGSRSRRRRWPSASTTGGSGWISSSRVAGSGSRRVRERPRRSPLGLAGAVVELAPGRSWEIDLGEGSGRRAGGRRSRGRGRPVRSRDAPAAR